MKPLIQKKTPQILHSILFFRCVNISQKHWTLLLLLRTWCSLQVKIVRYDVCVRGGFLYHNNISDKMEPLLTLNKIKNLS